MASCLVAAAGNHPSSDGYSPAAQTGVITLLDGGKEGIDIQMQDEGAVVGVGFGEGGGLACLGQIVRG